MDPASSSRPEPDTASVARVYDFWLGGKDNYVVDQEHAAQVAADSPWVPQVAVANRRCMARAVGYCAAQGISQFLTIGTGLPTAPSSYSAAWGIDPGAVVIGVDNDPVVRTHGRALAGSAGNRVRVLDGDLRQIEKILADLDADREWEWERPGAVDLGAVLHFVDGAHDPHAIVAALRERLAAGSYLIVSHASTDGTPEEVVASLQARYENASEPLRFRCDAQIGGFLGDWEVLEPGVVAVQDWPHPQKPAAATPLGPRVRLAAGVARKPG